jgi:hypothetical protein
MRFAFAAVVVSAALLAGCERRYGPWEPAGNPSGPRAALTDFDYVGGDRLPPVPSAVVATLAGGFFATMIVATAALAWANLRRARSQRAIADQGARPLTDGPQRIAGVIEAVGAENGPALVARVYQTGKEWQAKGTTMHTWQEVRREVVARPFHLRRADGTLVRVEPDEATILEAPLERIERHARDVRTRVAEVGPGATVQVLGELHGAAGPSTDAAYRGPPGPLLRPQRGAPMIVSAEPPGETARRRARFHGIWCLAFVALASVVVGATIVDLILLVDGVVVSATPTSTQLWEEWKHPKNSKGYWDPHHRVRARATVGGETASLEDDCGILVYQCVKAGTCPRLPFLVAEHLPSSHRVGRQPSLPDWTPGILVLALAMLGSLYPASTHGTRPWYRRRPLVDQGEGKLDAPEAR